MVWDVRSTLGAKILLSLTFTQWQSSEDNFFIRQLPLLSRYNLIVVATYDFHIALADNHLHCLIRALLSKPLIIDGNRETILFV